VIKTTKVLPHWIEQWREQEAKYIDEGLSRSEAWRRIGAEYDISHATVQHHISPGMKEQKAKYLRKNRHKKSEEAMLRGTETDRRRRQAAQGLEAMLDGIFNGKALTPEEILDKMKHLYQHDYKYRDVLPSILKNLGLQENDGYYKPNGT